MIRCRNNVSLACYKRVFKKKCNGSWRERNKSSLSIQHIKPIYLSSTRQELKYHRLDFSSSRSTIGFPYLFKFSGSVIKIRERFLPFFLIYKLYQSRFSFRTTPPRRNNYIQSIKHARRLVLNIRKFPFISYIPITIKQSYKGEKGDNHLSLLEIQQKNNFACLAKKIISFINYSSHRNLAGLVSLWQQQDNDARVQHPILLIPNCSSLYKINRVSNFSPLNIIIQIAEINHRDML